MNKARIEWLLGVIGKNIKSVKYELGKAEPKPKTDPETAFQVMVRECIQSKYMGCGVMGMPWDTLTVIYNREIARLTKLFNATVDLALCAAYEYREKEDIQQAIETLKEKN